MQIASALMLLSFLLHFSASVSAHEFKDCNASQFDFFPHYSLGAQLELNRTFALLNTEMQPLPDLWHNFSGTLYKIEKTTVESSYLSSKQTA